MGALLTVLAPILGDVLKRVIPDSDKSMEIEREVKLALLEHSDSIEALRGRIVLEEARSQHWMTSTWRPLLMMVMVVIIAMNYLFFPILQMVTGVDAQLELPPELWNLLTIGVGGYIVGRSGEKMVDKWKS